MTIAQYEELTGRTVSTAEQPLVQAQIKRAQSIIEELLGFSLSNKGSLKNYYNEKGKSPSDFSFPSDEKTLIDPDDVVYAYRLYPYNKNETYLQVDPFTKLNAVKLVFVQKGDSPNGITMKTLDTDELRIEVGAQGVSKYIQLCHDCLRECFCECRECVQLAVDAQWVWEECTPKDLLYVWADMVTYYADCKRDIKSETLGSHSYTKFSGAAPETMNTNLAVLKKYAGPYGSLNQVIVL